MWHLHDHAHNLVDLITQREPHGLQGGTEPPAVLPPRAFNIAAAQLKHAQAFLLQKANHKAQKRPARRATGRVRDAERQPRQAGVRSRGLEARAEQQAASRKAQAAQVWEACQAAQGAGVQGAPNPQPTTRSMAPKVQLLKR